MSKKPDQEQPEKITRDDLEAKFRQVTGDMNDTAQRLTRGAITLGTAAIVIALILVFIVGRSKGKKKTTLVEIVRV